MVRRIIAIAFVYLIAVAGWVFLAGTITYRTDNQDESLKREVNQLWGTPLAQRAPWARLNVERKTDVEVTDPQTHQRSINHITATEEVDMPIAQNNIRMRLNSTSGRKACCGIQLITSTSRAVTRLKTSRTSAARWW